jgi:predicted CXXCH cytochrome family protein
MKRALLLLALAIPLYAAGDKNTCLDCHSMLDGPQGAPAKLFKDDIHGHRGFGCADCHGGDPTNDDMAQAMSKARGFKGKIARTAVPQLCGRCHSDANLIHKFKPQQRVDQYAQYQTSVHGQRSAKGDTAVANCVDCHSVHNIRETRDALSPVHPLRLPETCARCHADKGHMASYKIPTNQFEEYRKSVHWVALAKRGDLSAPSCATCHGNHGAAPPAVNSVAAVCGTCHVMMEELYSASPHKPVFASMGLGGCVVCHTQHGIQKPSTKMLEGKEGVCATCHDSGTPGGKTAAAMAADIRKLESALDRSDALLSTARRDGMEVSEALVRQVEARENLIKARVAVHAFREPAVGKPVQDGLAIAAETYKAGEAALTERNYRRYGLMISLAAILLTMAGLWLAIRAIERRSQPAPNGKS